MVKTSWNGVSEEAVGEACEPGWMSKCWSDVRPMEVVTVVGDWVEFPSLLFAALSLLRARLLRIMTYGRT